MRRTTSIAILTTAIFGLTDFAIANADTILPVPVAAQASHHQHAARDAGDARVRVTDHDAQQVYRRLAEKSPDPDRDLAALPGVDWEMVGRKTHRSAQQAREQYVAAVERYLANPSPIRIRETPVPAALKSTAADVITKSFTVTVIPGVAAIQITISYDTTAMTGQATVAAQIFGYSVASQTFSVSIANRTFELHPNLGLVKADLVLRLVGDRLCLSVQGQACIRRPRWGWPPWTWSCRSGNVQNVFCLLG